VQILFGAVIGVLAVAALGLLAAQRGPRRSCSRVPGSFPYSKKKLFFSAAERSFYEILRRIAPDHTVFAKVRLCDLTSVSSESKIWQINHNRSQSKQLDLLICDAALAPVMAIEFDDSPRERADRNARDQFVGAALVAAAVPIVRIRRRRSYMLEDIRPLVSPHLHGLGPLC